MEVFVMMAALNVLRTYTMNERATAAYYRRPAKYKVSVDNNVDSTGRWSGVLL